MMEQRATRSWRKLKFIEERRRCILARAACIAVLVTSEVSDIGRAGLDE